jgi:hypothetical protein
VWRLEAVVGARTPTLGAAAEPQAALAVSLWPPALRGHVGAGAVVQAGPGTTLESAAFSGQFTQASVGLNARARIGAGPLAFELQAGPSIRITSLDGEALATSESEHAVRVNPAVDAGGVFDVALGPHIALGALLDVSALLRFQHYVLNGALIFDEPMVDLLFGARLAVEVD